MQKELKKKQELEKAQLEEEKKKVYTLINLFTKLFLQTYNL